MGHLRKFTCKGRITWRFPVLIDNGNVTDEPLEVANAFGRFFASLSA